MPECPVCAADVSLADDAEVGELMECPDCGTELEVTGLELAAIEFMERHDLAEQERRKGERLRAALEPRLPAVVRELRQIGLTVGIELKQKAQPYLRQGQRSSGCCRRWSSRTNSSTSWPTG